MQRSAECLSGCRCLSVSELKHKTGDGIQAQYKPCRLRSELHEYRLACTNQENMVSIHAPRDATPDNAGTAAERFPTVGYFARKASISEMIFGLTPSFFKKSNMWIPPSDTACTLYHITLVGNVNQTARYCTRHRIGSVCRFHCPQGCYDRENRITKSRPQNDLHPFQDGSFRDSCRDFVLSHLHGPRNGSGFRWTAQWTPLWL